MELRAKLLGMVSTNENLTGKEKALLKHLIQEDLTSITEDDFIEFEECEIMDMLEQDLSSVEDDYTVLTDYEAKEEFKEQVLNTLYDCYEIPEFLVNYINEDKWVRDVELSDGRGSTLASYDGIEHEYIIEDETFYIYRQN